MSKKEKFKKMIDDIWDINIFIKNIFFFKKKKDKFSSIIRTWTNTHGLYLLKIQRIY